MNHYTFDAFLVDDTNRAAYEAARKASRGEDFGPAPLVLVGGPGSGKTHLLSAIVNEVVTSGAKMSLGYVTDGNFPARAKALIADPSPLDRVDAALLLVDELDSFATHLNELEVLLGLFLDAGHPVVLASRERPEALERLSPAIKARLGQGQELTLAVGDGATVLGALAEPDSGLEGEFEGVEYPEAQPVTSADDDDTVPGDLRAQVAAAYKERDEAKAQAAKLIERVESLFTQIEANRARHAQAEAERQGRIRMLEAALQGQPQATPENAVAQLTALRAKFDAERERLEAALTDTRDGLQRDLDAARRESSEARTALAVVRAEAELARAMAEQYRAETADAKAQAEAAEASRIEAEAEAAELREARERLAADYQTLNAALETARAAQAAAEEAVEDARKESAALQEALDRVPAERAAWKAKLHDASEAQRALEAQLAALQADNTHIAADRDVARQALAEAETRIEALETEQAEWAARSKRDEDEREKLEQAWNGVRTEAKRLAAALSEEEARHRAAREALEAAHAEGASLRENLAEVHETLDTRTAELERTEAALASEREARAAIENTLEATTAERDVARAEREGLRAELAEAHEALDTRTAELAWTENEWASERAARTSAEELLEAISAERDGVRQHAARVQADLVAAQVERDELQTRLATAHLDRDRLQTEAAQAAAVLRNAEDALRHQREDAASLRAQLEALHAAHAERAAAHDRDRAERDAAQAAVHTLQARVDALTAEHGALTQALEAAQGESARLAAAAAEAAHGRDRLWTVLGGVRRDLHDARQQLLRLTRSFDELAQVHAAKEDALESARVRLGQLTSELESSEAARGVAAREAAQFKKQLDLLRRENKDLRRTLENTEAERDTHARDLLDMQKRRDALAERARELERTVAGLEAEIDDVRRDAAEQTAAAHAMAGQLEARLTRAQRALVRTEATRRVLATELVNLQGRLSDTTGALDRLTQQVQVAKEWDEDDAAMDVTDADWARLEETAIKLGSGAENGDASPAVEPPVPQSEAPVPESGETPSRPMSR